MSPELTYTLIVCAKIVFVFGIAITSIPVLVLVERKLLGWMQMRPGPNRVGPWGILQTMADGIKLLFKEDVIPDNIDRPTYHVAPLLVICPALIVVAVIPFGPVIEVAGYEIGMSIADLDYGLLYVFAVASLTTYGIVLAGWSSNNKWSLLGGMRSMAQMISYEVTLTVSIVGVLLLCQTFSLREIADAQSGGFWKWNVFSQPLGFLLFFIAGVAETNRLPFDFPEGESELTGGFHTEYSSMRFAMFFMGEYMNVFIMSCILATLFLGGFHPPYPYEFGTSWLEGMHGFAWVGIKIAFFVFLFIWLRGTLPRLRFDQLMRLGWQVMLPLAFLNLFATAVLIALRAPWWVMGLVGLAVIVVADLLMSRLFWSVRRAVG